MSFTVKKYTPFFEDTKIDLYVNDSLDYFEGIKTIDNKKIVWGHGILLCGEIRTRIQNWIYRNLYNGQNFYFRATDNKKEISLIKENPNLKSKNSRDNFTEKGLSVSEHSRYKDFFNYKYVYVVTGKMIGYGSDGEPLLQNIKVLSPLNKISRYEAKQDIIMKKNLKQMNLTEKDYENIRNYNINFIDYNEVDLSK